MTEAALTAQAIRKELKAIYPSIKFRVTSRNFAGGDAVDVSYENGVPSDEINKIVNKYQYGHFNGMIDMYEDSNVNDSIPQVKYVQVSRDITDDHRMKVKSDIAQQFGIVNVDDEQEWFKTFHSWSDQVIWRELSKLTF